MKGWDIVVDEQRVDDGGWRVLNAIERRQDRKIGGGREVCAVVVFLWGGRGVRWLFFLVVDFAARLTLRKQTKRKQSEPRRTTNLHRAREEKWSLEREGKTSGKQKGLVISQLPGLRMQLITKRREALEHNMETGFFLSEKHDAS